MVDVGVGPSVCVWGRSHISRFYEVTLSNNNNTCGSVRAVEQMVKSQRMNLTHEKRVWEKDEGSWVKICCSNIDS